jgi:hypothetical protein
MNEINDSNSHLLDGIDPDAPRPRSRGHPEAERLLFDLQELRQLSEADVTRYCGSTIPGSNYIKR